VKPAATSHPEIESLTTTFMWGEVLSSVDPDAVMIRVTCPGASNTKYVPTYPLLLKIQSSPLELPLERNAKLFPFTVPWAEAAATAIEMNAVQAPAVKTARRFKGICQQ